MNCVLYCEKVQVDLLKVSAPFDDPKSGNCVLYLMENRAVYEELGKYGDVENQVLCRQRVEELDPSIRYCSYKMGNSNIQGSDLLDLSTQEGPGLDLLQSKLEVSQPSLQCTLVPPRKYASY